MRPRFGSAIADRTSHATADPSRWTHRVGVTGRALGTITPTRNAIGLSSPVGVWLTVAMGELSPWRSVLPPSGGGGASHIADRQGAVLLLRGIRRLHRKNASARREDIMHNRLTAASAALVLAASCAAANAQEVTLKGITSFAEKTLNSRSFERFIDIVNTVLMSIALVLTVVSGIEYLWQAWRISRPKS